MSSNVDNRIVQMQFNGDEFEKGVSDAQKALEDLNKTLANLGSGEHGEHLTLALSGVGDAVDETQKKFSVLEEFVTGIFRRLGEEVADLGLGIVKELSFGTIIDGYEKYESQIEKTAGLINAAKFQGYEDPEAMVTQSLAKIQWFADATSYSYDAMVSAFLAFVNADVPMERAINLIIGMGSAFSDAGAVATQVGGAFNVLAKSVGNGAMMYQSAMRQLQSTYKVISPQTIQSYIDAAEALGYLQKVEEGIYETTSKAHDEGISKQKGGATVTRASLNTITGWLNGAVLQKVYDMYGFYGQAVYDIQNEMAETTGVVVTLSDAMNEVNKRVEEGKLDISSLGDTYEEALEKFELSQEAFLASQEATTWGIAIDAVKDGISSIWKTIFENTIGNYEEARELFTNIQDYLLVVFGGTVEKLSEVLGKWKADGGRQALLDGLKNIVKGIESIVGPFKTAWDKIFPPMSAQRLLDITNKFKDFTEKLIISENTTKTLSSIWEKVLGVFKGVIDIFKQLFKFLKSGLDAIKPLFEIFGSIILWFEKISNGFIKMVDDLGVIDNIGNWFTWAFTTMKNSIKDFYESFTGGKSIIESVSGWFKSFGDEIGVTKEDFEEFKNSIKEFNEDTSKKLSKAFENVAASIGGAFHNIVAWVGNAFTKIGSSIKYVIDNIELIATSLISVVEYAVGSVAALFKKIESTLVNSTKEVAEKESTLLDSYKNKLTQGEGFFGKLLEIVRMIVGVIGQLIKLGILDEFKKLIHNFAELPKVINSFKEPVNELTNTLKSMQKEIKANIIKTIAIAVGILAASMWVIAKIPQEKLFDSFKYISLLSLEVSAIMFGLSKFVKNAGEMKGVGTLMASVGAAVLLLGIAIKSVADIGDPTTIAVATVAIAAMIGLVIALIAVMGEMSKRPVGGLANLKNVKDYGYMFLKLASGILIIAQAMKMIGALGVTEILKGVGVLTLVIFGLMAFIDAIKETGKIDNDLSKIGTLLLMLSASLFIIAGALGLMTALDSTKLLTATGVLIVILTALVAVAKNIQTSGNDILKFSASIILIAAGMTVMAGALLALGLIPYNQMVQGLELLALLLISIGVLAAVLGSKDVGGVFDLGLSMIALALGFTALAAAIALVSLLPIDVLTSGLQLFAEALAVLAITNLLLTATGGAEPLLDMGFAMILMGAAVFLVSAGILKFVEALILLSAFMRENNLAMVVQDLLGSIIAAVSNSLEMIIDLIFDAIDLIIERIFGADGTLVKFCNNFVEFCQSDGFKTIMGAVLQLAEGIWNALFNWISGLFGRLVDTIGGVVKSVINHLIGWMPEDFKKVANQCMDGLLSGFKNAVNWVVDGVKNIGSTILGGLKDVLGIKSPSKEFAKIGNFSMEGLAKGLKESSNLPINEAEKAGDKTLDTLKKSLSGVSDLGDLDNTFTITPVLDLSEVQNGKSDLMSMLDTSSMRMNLSGITDSFNPTTSIMDTLSGIKGDLSFANANQINSEDFAGFIKEAITGMGIYADGTKIGKLVDVYQSNTARAVGSN